MTQPSMCDTDEEPDEQQTIKVKYLHPTIPPQDGGTHNIVARGSSSQAQTFTIIVPQRRITTKRIRVDQMSTDVESRDFSVGSSHTASQHPPHPHVSQFLSL
jgi:hypothetical protein